MSYGREETAVLLGALKAADQFISNGIEFGFIRMPDPNMDDPAKETPRLVHDALRDLSAVAGAHMDEVERLKARCAELIALNEALEAENAQEHERATTAEQELAEARKMVIAEIEAISAKLPAVRLTGEQK